MPSKNQRKGRGSKLAIDTQASPSGNTHIQIPDLNISEDLPSQIDSQNSVVEDIQDDECPPMSAEDSKKFESRTTSLAGESESQNSMSDWHESQITSTYGDSEYGDKNEFSAEQLLNYLEVRNTRTSSRDYKQLNPREELLHIKSQRIFFFCHLMGYTCRAKMLPSYDRPGATYLKNSQQQVVFEGIYVSLGFNSGELILDQVEEILYNGHNNKEETVAIFVDNSINIRMENVSCIEFSGHNITFSGVSSVNKAPQLPERLRPKPDQIFRRQPQMASTAQSDKTPVAGQQAGREIQTQGKTQKDPKVQSPSKSTKPSQNDKSNIWSKFELQTKQAPIKANSKTQEQTQVIETNAKATSEKVQVEKGKVKDLTELVDKQQVQQKQQKSPKRQKTKKNKKNLSLICVDMEMDSAPQLMTPSPQAAANKKINKTMTSPKTAGTSSESKAGVRELVRYNVDQNGSDKALLLENIAVDNQKFNQFQGKKTNFTFDMYSTQIDSSAITTDQKKQADILEDELQDTRNELDLTNPELNENEELIHSSVIRTSAQNENKSADDELPTVVKKQHSDQIEKKAVNTNHFTQRLAAALGPLKGGIEKILDGSSHAIGKKSFDFLAASNMDQLHIGCGIQSRKTSDVNSRTSSIRNGEASKIMDLHNLEGPQINKEQFDEYQEFIENERPFDRRASQDFFAAEQERMERELQEIQQKRLNKQKFLRRKRKFTCFNTTVDQSKSIDQCFQQKNEIIQPSQDAKSLLQLF